MKREKRKYEEEKEVLSTMSKITVQSSILRKLVIADPFDLLLHDPMLSAEVLTKTKEIPV